MSNVKPSRPNANGPCGLVVSDLHLFARRSEGFVRFEALRAQLSRINTLVLNGDTFDFRWSSLRSQPATVEAALEWLAALASEFGDCQIHFVHGNHDCLAKFKDGLEELVATSRNLHSHDYLLQLGSCLFVHGDCAHRPMRRVDLERYRSNWKAHGRRGALGTAAYLAADRLGLTRLVHEWHFPRDKTVARIAGYLDDARPGWRSSTRQCYFGHTHLPFSDHEHQGVRFHNTGSAIRGMGFNPLFFEPEPMPENNMDRQRKPSCARNPA